MAKAAAGIEAGAETEVGHLQAETAAGQLRPQRWPGYLPCRDGGGGIDGIRNGDSGQAEPPGVRPATDIALPDLSNRPNGMIVFLPAAEE